jgi:hypothetical protein
MTENKPKSRKNDLVIQDLEKETLVYDLKTNQAFCLNQTSGLVWQFCNGNNSIADISNLVSKELRILVSEDFVLLALNELKKNNLLENDAQFEQYFTGFNRREIIKRVGFASMIALPIISTVIAPTAANAASTNCANVVSCPPQILCCLPGQVCTTQLNGMPPNRPACCPSTQAFGILCCNPSETVTTTGCCPTAQACNGSAGSCCSSLSARCVGTTCCNNNNLACGTTCCAAGAIGCSGNTCIFP